jgi:hypothetical protein
VSISAKAARSVGIYRAERFFICLLVGLYAYKTSAHGFVSSVATVRKLAAALEGSPAELQRQLRSIGDIQEGANLAAEALPIQGAVSAQRMRTC